MQEGSGAQGGVQKIRTFAMDSALAHTTLQQAPAFIPPKEEAAVSVPPVPQTRPAPIAKVAPQTPQRAPQTQAPFISKKETQTLDTAPVVQHASKKYITLEEDTQKIAVHRTDSILSDNPNIDVGDSGGTIIRDTKRKRFQLFPAVAQATTQWFENKKVAYDDYAHPYESMTRAEARADVIHAAVEKSALAPREDFSAIVERKKYEERKPISSTLIIKEKEELPTPQWSYIEDDSKSETTAPEITTPQTNTPPAIPDNIPTPNPIPVGNIPEVAVVAPAAPSVEKPTGMRNPYAPSVQVQTTPQEIPAPVIPVIPEIVSEVTTPSVVELERATPPREVTAPAVAVPQPIPTPIPDTRAFEPEGIAPEEGVRNPYDAFATPTPQKTSAASARYEYRSSNTRAPIPFPQYALIAVVFVAIISGVGLSVYLFAGKDAPQEVAVVYTVPQLIRADAKISQPLTDRNSFLNGLTGITLQNSGVVQMYPSVRLQDGSERPASAQETLGVLGTRMPSSFTRAIRELTFGAVGNEPFIVMNITSFDIAFAGMLEWEQTMSADLAPLYGTPVIESFDPSARTDSQARSAFFKDTIASNKNARLLFDEKGNDRLIYTFVDQNTIVITTNRGALEQILPLLP